MVLNRASTSMKLRDYILQTLTNRLTMLWLGSGPYTSTTSSETKSAKLRIDNIFRERTRKWGLLSHFSKNQMTTHNHLPNTFPNFFITKLPSFITYDDGQLCYSPTYRGQQLIMFKEVAHITRSNILLVCKLTNLQYLTAQTEHSRVHINLARSAGYSPEWIAMSFLHEWPDGSFRDTAPNSPEGSALDVNGVGGYHGQHRPWASISFKDAKVFGIELETLAPTDSLRVSMANEARKLGMLAERDGSLAERGLEIIAPPMTYEQVADTKGPWFKWIETAKAAGFTAWYALNAEGDPGGYGMHVNLNRRHFDPLHLEKLIFFINTQMELSRKVAGRSSRQYALLAPKILGLGVHETNKYQAVAVRSPSRVEVRIFRATMRWEGFLRNLEFTDACIEFTRKCANDAINSDNFLKWLDEKKEYPNLKEFLPQPLTQRYQLEV